jgi:hypothetical protein
MEVLMRTDGLGIMRQTKGGGMKRAARRSGVA